MTKIESKFTLQNSIAELRRVKNITQQELADAIHVTRATIVALEKGNYNPSLELGFRLADFFNTPIEQIFYKRGSHS